MTEVQPNANEDEINPPSKIKETKLYDELDVDPSASFTDLRKSYWRLAMKHHPDKNEGNATEKVI